jgi:hypothetical protein
VTDREGCQYSVAASSPAFATGRLARERRPVGSGCQQLEPLWLRFLAGSGKAGSSSLEGGVQNLVSRRSLRIHGSISPRLLMWGA